MKKGLEVNVNGTFLISEFQCDYHSLVRRIGPPHCDGDQYKVDVEWMFEEDGVVATIYNWKDGPNYTGHGRIEDLEYWHIGGFDSRAEALVLSLLDESKGEAA